ncbi:MAG: hypothetical protein ACT4P6_22690 [Gemmatimonadaceae bacterium]
MGARVAVEMNWPDVEVDDFTKALNAQLRLVREVMSEMGLNSDAVRWVIVELRKGSTYAGVEAIIDDAALLMDDVDRAIAESARGYTSLRQVAERPPYFNDEALETCRELAELRPPSDAGLTRLQFGNEAVEPSLHVAANVEEITVGRFQSIGSVDGFLYGVMTAEGGYRISIKDRARGKAVHCTVPREMRKDALDSFEQRVIVRGIIWSRKDGHPQRIEAKSIERVLPDDQLPDV